ncbi:unnamed protein product [Amoebophrya sp. A120]|nr:unnamed protein product [Amoebophrya sp. A120]|eukprot:GSA120T00017330001.1
MRGVLMQPIGFLRPVVRSFGMFLHPCSVAGLALNLRSDPVARPSDFVPRPRPRSLEDEYGNGYEKVESNAPRSQNQYRMKVGRFTITPAEEDEDSMRDDLPATVRALSRTRTASGGNIVELLHKRPPSGSTTKSSCSSYSPGSSSSSWSPSEVPRPLLSTSGAGVSNMVSSKNQALRCAAGELQPSAVEAKVWVWQDVGAAAREHDFGPRRLVFLASFLDDESKQQEFCSTSEINDEDRRDRCVGLVVSPNKKTKKTTGTTARGLGVFRPSALQSPKYYGLHCEDPGIFSIPEEQSPDCITQTPASSSGCYTDVPSASSDWETDEAAMVMKTAPAADGGTAGETSILIGVNKEPPPAPEERIHGGPSRTRIEKPGFFFPAIVDEFIPEGISREVQQEFYARQELGGQLGTVVRDMVHIQSGGLDTCTRFGAPTVSFRACVARSCRARLAERAREIPSLNAVPASRVWLPASEQLLSDVLTLVCARRKQVSLRTQTTCSRGLAGQAGDAENEKDATAEERLLQLHPDNRRTSACSANHEGHPKNSRSAMLRNKSGESDTSWHRTSLLTSTLADADCTILLKDDKKKSGAPAVSLTEQYDTAVRWDAVGNILHFYLVQSDAFPAALRGLSNEGALRLNLITGAVDVFPELIARGAF